MWEFVVQPAELQCWHCFSMERRLSGSAGLEESDPEALMKKGK